MKAKPVLVLLAVLAACGTDRVTTIQPPQGSTTTAVAADGSTVPSTSAAASIPPLNDGVAPTIVEKPADANQVSVWIKESPDFQTGIRSGMTCEEAEGRPGRPTKPSATTPFVFSYSIEAADKSRCLIVGWVLSPLGQTRVFDPGSARADYVYDETGVSIGTTRDLLLAAGFTAEQIDSPPK
jgi:hypothetical protein